MSSRKAFIDCVAAKANAQLDTTKDRISDPAKAEELKKLKNVTATKLQQYRQVLDEILTDEGTPAEIRANAKAAVDGLIESYEIKAAGKARSMLMGQKSASYISEIAKRGWGPETAAKGIFWASPEFRGSDIPAASQVLSFEDVFRSTRSQHYGRLEAAVSIMNDEAKIFFHTQNKEIADEVYKDLFNAGSGKPRSTNKVVKSAVDELIKYDIDNVAELRSRGVPIPEGGRKNYIAGKVQHNNVRLSTVSMGDYVADMMELYKNGGLNKELIDSSIPGKMSDDKLRIAFESIYKAETGQKLDVIPKALGARVASLHKSKEMHRLLEFTNYEAMKKFDSKYGYDNGSEKLTSIIDRNISTLTSLDVFGSDRASSSSQIRAALVKRYGEAGGAAFDSQYDQAIRQFGTGFRNPLDPNTASNISGVRAWTSSTLLGKHFFGALTTDWSINLPRTYARVGRSYFAPLYEGMKNLGARLSGDYAERELALRIMGGEVESMVMDIQNSFRSTNATGIAKAGAAAYKMVEIASGNRLATKINRRLAATTFANTLAEHIDTNGQYGSSPTIFGSLLHTGGRNATFKSFLEGFGITTADVMKLKPYMNKKGGLKFVDASKLPVGDNELRRIYGKLIAAQAALVEQSSPTSSAKVAAALSKMKEGGKFRAGLIDIHAMFLGYIGSMLQNNVLPILRSQGNAFNRAKAFAMYATMLTTAGVITEWLYDLVKGRDPQELSPSLVAKGVLRSGVGGPAMDYAVGMFMPGMGSESVTNSPVLGKLEDITKSTSKIVKGKDGGTHDLIKVAGNMVPGSALWWLETIYKQGIIHHLQEAADPVGTRKADARKRANEKRLGTQSFVQPDDILPEVKRAPNLENIKPKG